MIDMIELSEEQRQNRVIKWARRSYGKYPELKWLHCSLNGVKLTPQQAGRAKRMGMEKGITDLCLPVSRKGFGCCWIEMKKDTGYVAQEQRDFKDFVTKQGHYHVFCYAQEEAISALKWYLQLPE